MKRVPCKGCGVVVLILDDDDPNRPHRCADCWRSTPIQVLVRESHEYDERRKKKKTVKT